MFGPWTYLIFELGWAMPVLVLHWAVGYRLLRHGARTLLAAVAIPTLYLTLADSVAIRNGIWTLHADRVVGLYLGNVPIEETIFFLVTNMMVVQSILLVHGFRKAH